MFLPCDAFAQSTLLAITTQFSIDFRNIFSYWLFVLSFYPTYIIKKEITDEEISFCTCYFIISLFYSEKNEFVNPIFYKTMYPIPITAWETKLTPTSYISQNKGLKITGDCILLENEQDHIKLKCEMQYPFCLPP